jgi:hypothetical protein
MDFCLASDERDYKEEVIFSPYIIGNTDGNVLPVKIDLNNPDNSELFVLEYDNYNPFNIIVSSNYYNPDNLDLSCFSGFSALCDVGLTGIDNGLVKNMTGETAYITKGINDFTKFDRLSFDRRMKFFQVTGYTQPPNIRFSGIPKNDNYSIVSYQKDVGVYHELYGGFYQGFYKLYGYDYEILPDRPHHGWSAEFLLRPRIWDDYFPSSGDTTLNEVYPDNAGIFFYMGARAENKFYHYASGSPSGFTAYTRVTESLVSTGTTGTTSGSTGETTCLLTCGCSNSGNTLSNCLPVYPPQNYITETTPCGTTQITAPELNPSGDSCSNNFAVKLSGDPGNPRICVRVLRLTDECTIDQCTSAKTYTSGCTVQEYCTPKGIHYFCENTDYVKFEHWVQVDVVFERYRDMDECHLWWYGGLGVITNFELTASTYNQSVTLIQPPFTHFNVVTYTSTTTTYTATTIDTPYGREVVELNNKWLQQKDYRLGRLKIYVNGRRFHTFENFEEVIPRALNTEREKQIGVPFNLSWGGGTQGLRENLTFKDCPVSSVTTTTTTLFTNSVVTTTTTTFYGNIYQQDPELFPDSVLSGTSLSGLNTNIVLEKYFAGTFDGGISQFNYYIKPMTADEVKHNYLLNKTRYNLFDWDCPNCDVFVPECDLSAIVYEYTTTTTTIPTTTTTTTSIPCDINYDLFNVPSGTELTLIVNMYPGSIEAAYNLQLNNVLDFDLSISFTQVLGTISGDSINIDNTIIIPRGSFSAETTTIIDGDYNILDDTSEIINLVWTPYWVDLVIGFSSETIFNLNPCNQYLTTEGDDFIVAEDGRYIVTEIDLCDPCVVLIQTEFDDYLTTEENYILTSERNPCLPIPSPTITPTSTVTPTPTPTITPTITPTSSVTPTPTPSITPTITPSASEMPMYPLTLYIQPLSGGQAIIFDGITYTAETTVNVYLNTFYNIESVPIPGYMFVGWNIYGGSFSSTGQSTTVAISLTSGANLAPSYDVDPNYDALEGQLTTSLVSYQNATDNDWVIITQQEYNNIFGNVDGVVKIGNTDEQVNTRAVATGYDTTTFGTIDASTPLTIPTGYYVVGFVAESWNQNGQVQLGYTTSYHTGTPTYMGNSPNVIGGMTMFYVRKRPSGVEAAPASTNLYPVLNFLSPAYPNAVPDTFGWTTTNNGVSWFETVSSSQTAKIQVLLTNVKSWPSAPPSSPTPTPSPTPTLTLTPNCQRNIVIPTLWNGGTTINTNQLILTQTSETLQIQVNDIITDNNGSTSFVGIVSSDGTYTYVFTGAGGGVAFDCQFPLTFTGPC